MPTPAAPESGTAGEMSAGERRRQTMSREADASGRVPAFLAAVMAGDELAVAAALAEAPALAWARSDVGVSAVCLAMYYEQRDVARHIAGRRHDLDVFEASVIGDADWVAALVAASPELVRAFSPDGFQPLGYACFLGHRALFELLLRLGAPVDEAARNAMAVRPIHSAVAQRDPVLAVEMVGMLLAAGASPNVAQQGGFTPLHQAAHRGHLELVRLLLDHGADRDARTGDGKTPAEMARAAGHEAVAILLGG